uniref:Uncharacterized protein n=1 Tax=Mycena chlorophos TaxID=658473 RepID=A0ABQ0M9W2_MYCCL|nr:predicted protein [Mycena chlorophos]
MQVDALACPDYCVGCNRQFVPRRVLVPVDAQLASPDVVRKGTRGLVHGTGRVRVNGTIKAAPPVKTRVEIDQSPAPLYCSPECEQRDLDYSSGTSDTGDEADSILVLSTKKLVPPPRSTPNTRSMAYLESRYDMPPLPAPTSETYDEFAPPLSHVETMPPPPEFTSGVMMAGRRISANLPAPRKPGQAPSPVTAVPGWTDGSPAWRASTYSFAPPPRTRADVTDPNRAAYGSIVATPHRSASGVVATKEPSSPTTTSYSSSSSNSSRNSDMLSSFEDSFARRSMSRISLYSPGSSPASSLSCSPTKHSKVWSMLLLPEAMRPRAGSTPSSSTSLDSLPRERTARRHSAGSLAAHSYPGPRPRMRSPLSIPATLDDEENNEALLIDEAELEHSPRRLRPTMETRSWSYDNVRTYPMPLPTVKELRIVDGVEQIVEVPRKVQRLFTFADTVVSPPRSISEMTV